MSAFLDGLMKGYKFMENIDEVERKRAREDYLFERVKKADARADLEQVGRDTAAFLKDWRMGPDGNPRSLAELKKDPKAVKRLIDFANLPAFKPVRMQGVKDKNIADVKLNDIAINEDNSVTPIMTQIDKNGRTISTGPATNGRTNLPKDTVVNEDFDQLLSQLENVARYAPNYVANKRARLKEASVARDTKQLGSYLASQAQPEPTPAPAAAQQPRTQQPRTESVAIKPVEFNKPTQPEAPIDKPAKGGGLKANLGKLQDRAAQPSLLQKANAAVEDLGKAFANKRSDDIARMFDRATNPDLSMTGPDQAALRAMQSKPLEAADQFLKNRYAIEKRLGKERTEQLRKDLLEMTSPEAMGVDITDRDKYKRISRMQKDLVLAQSLDDAPPKAKKALESANKSLKEDPEELARQLNKDMDTMAKMRPGTKVSKQREVGAPKEVRDAVTRLYLNGKVPFESWSRFMKTGRFTKNDLKVVANQKYIAIVDKQAGTANVIKTFGEGRKPLTPSERLAQSKYRNQIFREYADTKYPDWKKDPRQAKQHDMMLKRWSRAMKGMGIPPERFAENYAMVSEAEDIINRAVQNSGWFKSSWFKSKTAEDYPTLEMSIIGQGLAARDLKEAEDNFFAPLNSTKYFSNKKISSDEARELAKYAMAGQMDGMSLPKITGALVSILNSSDPTAYRRFKPYDFVQHIKEIERRRSQVGQ